MNYGLDDENVLPFLPLKINTCDIENESKERTVGKTHKKEL